MKYADVDRIYRTLPLDNIPWNSETPPDALSGALTPVQIAEGGLMETTGS